MMATYQTRGSNCQAEVRVKGPDGKLVRKTKTFRRKTDARRWAEKIEAEIRSGRWTEEEQARLLLVSDVIELWLFQGLKNLKGKKQQRRRRAVLKWWLERLGSVPVKSLKSSQVAKQLDTLEVATSTRNRYKSALGACFKLAIKRGDLGRSDDPTHGLHERELNARIRWLDEEERARLFHAAKDDPWLDLVIWLALTTGMREGEIAALRWRDIDYVEKRIRVEAATVRDASKSGRARLVPLVPEVESRLRERQKLRHIASNLVFPGRTGKPSWPRFRWEAVRIAAGLEDVRFHDLRHTAATLLLSEGRLGLSEVGEILGHRDIETTRRYAHLVRERVVDAAREALLTIKFDNPHYVDPAFSQNPILSPH